MKYCSSFVLAGLLSMGCGAPTEGDFDAQGEETSLGETNGPTAKTAGGAYSVDGKGYCN
ncbi:MAG TPA: hypothetical protein VER04_03480 [Polyangiaceae bacterium]|nr:hypothetical protein [Polyangiaceae bacterium]